MCDRDGILSNAPFYVLFVRMTQKRSRADAQTRMMRLDQIAAQLKGEEPCTVEDLAKTHGVSRRTIARDLEIMRAQGMPIEAERGRGGGVRMDVNWGVGRLNLSYAESVDLLISLAVAEQMNSPLFLAKMGSIRRQLIASFSKEKRRAVEGIKKRISTALVEDLAVGDYVLVHVGYALHKVSPDEAARTLQLMAEAGVLQDELDEMTGADQ